MRNKQRFAILILLWFQSCFSLEFTPQQDSLYFFFERTVYLENLLVPGSWWANPALILPIDTLSIFSSNVGALGGEHTIASVRIIGGIDSFSSFGIGLTGVSGDDNRTLFAENGGTSFKSSFSSLQPSIEAAYSRNLGFVGAIGLLETFGTHNNDSTSSKYKYTWGHSLGYLSPTLQKIAAISIHYNLAYHHFYDNWWDNNIRLGLILEHPSQIWRSSWEYSFPLNSKDDIWNWGSHRGYKVFKMSNSLQYRKNLAILFGYSKDSEILTHNGSTFHGGIELQKTPTNRFFGGYEFGLGTSKSLLFFHRIWFNLQLVKSAQADSQ